MNPTSNPFLLLLDIFSSNHEPRGELVLLANLSQLVEDLQGQLSGGGYDKCSQTIVLAPLQAVQLFHNLQRYKNMAKRVLILSLAV